MLGGGGEEKKSYETRSYLDSQDMFVRKKICSINHICNPVIDLSPICLFVKESFLFLSLVGTDNSISLLEKGFLIPVYNSIFYPFILNIVHPKLFELELFVC